MKTLLITVFEIYLSRQTTWDFDLKQKRLMGIIYRPTEDEEGFKKELAGKMKKSLSNYRDDLLDEKASNFTFFIRPLVIYTVHEKYALKPPKVPLKKFSIFSDHSLVHGSQRGVTQNR